MALLAAEPDMSVVWAATFDDELNTYIARSKVRGSLLLAVLPVR
jgi:hypothetical protein